MKKRSKAAMKPAKVRPRKASKAVTRRGSAPADPTEVARVSRERDDALEQQAAITDILRVISNSPGDVQPVLDSVAEHSARICEAKLVDVAIVDNDVFRIAARFGQLGWSEESVPLDRSSVAGRSICDLQPVQVADMQNAGDEFRLGRELAIRHGHCTALSVPLIREGRALGAIVIRRAEVRPFEEKHIALLKAFANQAAIAIENVRLLNELRESLEQQTATAEVLRVISSCPTNIEPVLQAIVQTAGELCASEYSALYRLRDGNYHVACWNNAVAEWVSYIVDHPISVGRGTLIGRTALEGRTVHILDCLADPDYTMHEAARLGKQRSMLGVPLLHNGAVIGVIGLLRTSVKPFTEKQIELVTTFAAQAVIAIENTRLLSELRESLQEQTATSEVLQAVSSYPGDLQPVFDAMLEKAARICDAKFGNIFRWDGESLHLAATYNTPPAFYELRGRSPLRPGPGNPLSRLIATKAAVHVADLAAEPGYTEKRDSNVVSAVEIGGIRTVVVVPMLKEKELIGAISVYRQEVRPFSDKQIALVTNFAAQAVIAIENARLLDELRESLRQQTATADVLKVISRSTFDLPKVLYTLLESAARLCEADKGQILRPTGNDASYCSAANYRHTPEYEEHLKTQTFAPGRGGIVGRVLLEGKSVQISDVLADPEYAFREIVKLGDFRTILGVPLLREGVITGLLVLHRAEVRPFSDKQIKLVELFADQAVIAIENSRLFEAEQQRTRELAESLEQQTATSEVLQVISSSPGDLQPVFATMLANMVRVCDATLGSVYRFEDDAFRFIAQHNTLPAHAELTRYSPFRPGPKHYFARMIASKTVDHVADLAAEQGYLERRPEYVASVELGRVRTALFVPMLKESKLIGVFAVGRQEVRPFTDKQIELVENFASQAVIAIENARLLNELRQRTDELGRSVGELRALGEVTQAVNSTVDLGTVLTTIVAKATQLSSTEAGAIYVFDDAHQEFGLRATYGLDDTVAAELRNRRLRIGEGAISEAVERRMPIQIPDTQNDPSATLDIIMRAGFRALLIVPLLSTDRIVGALVVRRKQPGEFPKSTIELLQTFAAQSVLAIQNARLFESVESRTRELARSLEDLRAAQDRLVQTEKLASLGQLTAGIAHEIKNPLNFVNNFSAVSVELINELREALGGVHLDSKPRAEISEIADTLQGNLDKVVQHGKRADAIVKNMLLHSRQGSGEHRPVEINALVEESLNLAYHGARAEKQGFTITLERSFDPAAGEVDLFPQEITRALLNLISNGFYAATKRKAEANGGNYEPTLAATTKNLGDSIEIRIRDNGTGIPPEVKEKLFSPFFTTKPAGEGTGLGLSISHDIIVKQHGGSIEVDTQPGEFTEFRIVLPRAGASLVKSGGRA
jgi:two-component system, NtrC family, sensor kinase